MKNRFVKYFILIFMFIPIIIFAEDDILFMETNDGMFYIEIYGDGIGTYQKGDYEPIDITAEVSGNAALMNRINEYGSLMLAYDLDLGIPYSLENYNSYLGINFVADESNPLEAGCLLYYNDEFIPLDNGYYYHGEYDQYSFNNLYHDGKIFIINPTKKTYNLEDDGNKVSFDYFKFMNFDNSHFVFRNITNSLDDFDYFKSVSSEHGIDYDLLVSKYGDDYAIEDLKDNKTKLYNQVTGDKEIIGIYGAFLLNKRYNIPTLITDVHSTYNFSIKAENNYKNYKNLAIYNIDKYGMVKVDSGNFEENTWYATYNDDIEDYEYIVVDVDGYMIGDTIPSDTVFLEYTGVQNYRPVTTSTFCYYGLYYSEYYTFDGVGYNQIFDASEGDLISNYGQPVYIYDEYVVTSDTVFDGSKEYYTETEDGGYSGITFLDAKVGDSISEYSSKTGKDIYYEGLELVLNKDNIEIEDDYINFTCETSLDEYIYSLFVLTGVKDSSISPDANPETLDNIYPYIILGFISLIMLFLTKTYLNKLEVKK